MKHQTSIEMTKFLSAVARRLGVAEHTYVVGGAPRNWLINQPVKDLDVVIDTVALEGKDSAWFAEHLRKAIPTVTSLATNQYGVAILTISGDWLVGGENLKGEVIEIANARRESYEDSPTSKGKGYKPHLVEPADILTDLARRDFTLNTLLWRLEDLTDGPEHAEVLDMLGSGRKHLEEGVLQTPVDPDKTFSDDPTRCLRVIKFVAKYGFKVPSDMAASIRRNAPKLKGMPWDAVRKIVVEDILNAPNARRSIALLQDLGLAKVLREMLQDEPGFASAMGRSLNDKEALLLLDLLDLDWAIRTPIGFLDKAGQKRLRGILLSMDDAEGKAFVDALVKPPIDRPRLFDVLELPPNQRGRVTDVARNLLLEDPTLVRQPAKLEALTEEGFGGTKVAAERVVRRFLDIG